MMCRSAHVIHSDGPDGPIFTSDCGFIRFFAPSIDFASHFFPFNGGKPFLSGGVAIDLFYKFAFRWIEPKATTRMIARHRGCAIP
jgi:hypothetical protein